MAAPLRAIGTHVLRNKPTPKVWFDWRSFGSYRKTKAGAWIPTSVARKDNRFDEFRGFVQKQWTKMDYSSKFSMFEVLAKTLMYGLSGGGGAMLMKNVLDRMDKVETKVDEAVMEIRAAVNDVKEELAKSEDSSRKYQQETDDRQEKLRVELNELTCELLKNSKVSADGTKGT